MRLLSSTSRIETHAKDEFMISAGGSLIKVNGCGITNGTTGTWTTQAATPSMPGPASQPYPMPHLFQPELQKTDLEFRHLHRLGRTAGRCGLRGGIQ